MPSRVWSHLCDYAAIDGSGKPMIIGEFDRIFAENLPVSHPIFFVIVKWEGTSQETFTRKIRITGTNRETIVESPLQTVVIQSGELSQGQHIAIDAFMMTAFKKYGEYSVELILDNIPVHILPLHISQLNR